ncbi:hypothetical protein [Streptomyces boncukensis]|uniref:Uncharacterized protein n=1 Tax=Streptomyces boncukensis TaxID=2711219 RepID=A0A6G4X695_9ACTN|nr:hypothetical protein [Streptomyces boncukensis]NGO72773.1 hypothetical protein [Streptomyces boncukensis]
MDAGQVATLREVLGGSEWLRATRSFGGTLRSSVRAQGGGLLLVGTEAYEPWHLAAHLDDEAAWSGLPELSPTLVRHRVPPSAPAHLSVGMGRLEGAGTGETLLVVTPEPAGPCPPLLERLADARAAGATLLTLSAAERVPQLDDLVHESLAADDTLSLEMVQHLVSAAAGETAAPRLPHASARRLRLRDRLSRWADQLTAPPTPRW